MIDKATTRRHSRYRNRNRIDQTFSAPTSPSQPCSKAVGRNRPWRWLLFFAILGKSAVAGAQSSSYLEQFHAGTIGADVNVGSNGLNTFYGTFEGIGGSIVQITPGGKSVQWNPAGLAYMSRGQVYTEWSPPLNLRLNSFYNIENQINDEIDAGIVDYIRDRSTLDFREAQIDPNVKLAGRHGTISGIVKSSNVAFGAAIHNTTNLSSSFNIADARVIAVSEPSGGGTAIRFAGNLNGALTTELRMSGVSFAGGARIWNGLGIGAGYDRFSATLTARGAILPEAQVSSGAQEFAFNSPGSAHYDSLRGRIDGNFDGAAGRWRFGIGYHEGQRFAVDLAFFSRAELQLGGLMTVNYDEILAVNLSPEEGEPFLDAGQLIRDNFTGTFRRTTQVSNVRLRVPAHFAIGLSHLWPAGRASFVYGTFSGEAAVAFDYEAIKDTSEATITGERTYGIKPQHILHANLGAEWLQVRLGVLRTEFVSRHSRNEDDSEQSSVWLPIFALSGGIAVPSVESLRLDYALSLGLTSFLRLGFTLKL